MSEDSVLPGGTHRATQPAHRCNTRISHCASHDDLKSCRPVNSTDSTNHESSFSPWQHRSSSLSRGRRLPWEGARHCPGLSLNQDPVLVGGTHRPAQSAHRRNTPNTTGRWFLIDEVPLYVSDPDTHSNRLTPPWLRAQAASDCDAGFRFEFRNQESGNCT